MNEIIHNTGVRLVRLRQKLSAREGIPGYKKNCEEIRKEISRLERTTQPSAAEIEAAWKAAEEDRKNSVNSTASQKPTDD